MATTPDNELSRPMAVAIDFKSNLLGFEDKGAPVRLSLRSEYDAPQGWNQEPPRTSVLRQVPIGVFGPFLYRRLSFSERSFVRTGPP